MFQQQEIQTLTAKQKILLTAHDLFYQEGIRATGIDKIIANAKVTKTTFYRHFSSKNILIIEFLKYRHQLWIEWFSNKINQYDNTNEAICAAMEEWFSQPTFRGCAFLNSLSEISAELPESLLTIKNHKRDVANTIEKKLNNNCSDAKMQAKTISMAIDGAILRAQSGEDIKETINLLHHNIKQLLTT